MLFQTTEAHEALRAKVREFAETEVKPLTFLLDKENEFPTEAIEKFAKMGMMGLPYPKKIRRRRIRCLELCHCCRGTFQELTAAQVLFYLHTSLSKLSDLRFRN